MVTNRTFLLENTSVSVYKEKVESYKIRYLDNQVKINVKNECKAILVDMNGKKVKEWIFANEFVYG